MLRKLYDTLNEANSLDISFKRQNF